MGTVIFIFFLILVSGGVAWLGDYLGRRIGKARMRLFNLRPKHTSILVAVITGMVITAITITVLAVASKDVRVMLFELKKIQTNLVTVKSDLQQVQNELDETYKALTTTQAQLDRAKSELNTANADLDAAKATIMSKDKDLILKKELIEEIESKLATTKAEFEKQKNDLEAAKAERTKLESDVKNLRYEAESQATEITSLQSERKRLNDDVKSLEMERVNLDKEVGDLNSQIVKLSGLIETIREGGVKVLEGQIIGEFVVETSLTDADILKMIKGAKKYWDDEDTDNPGRNPMEEVDIQQYTDVVAKIRHNQGEYGDQYAVIRIVSRTHVFEDEPVPVTLKVERYLRIYRQGEIITSTYFKVGSTQREIRTGILEMLENLKTKAQQEGMIFEGVEKVVHADFNIVVELSQKAVYYPNDIKVNLVAKGDIYNIEYLVAAPDVPESDNMEFQIEQIEPATDWASPP